MTSFTRIAGALGTCAVAARLATLPLRHTLPDLTTMVAAAAIGLVLAAHVGLLYRLRGEPWVLVAVALEVVPFLIPALPGVPVRTVLFVLGEMVLGAAVVVTDGLPLGAGLLIVIAAPLLYFAPFVALLVLLVAHLTLYVAMWLERPRAVPRAA